MQTVAEMRKHYDTKCGAKVFQPALQFGEAGLTLGRGTVLVSNSGSGANSATQNLDRIAVLLSATYGRQVPPQALRSVTRAVWRWRESDGALAHIELAFARLPRLQSEDDAFRLFLAAALLDDGHTPQWLARELGFDADLLKYDPDQPRVPAGSGRASGQWGAVSPREALLGLPAAGSADGSFLADAAPGVVQALARFAAHFSVPTAVLGALFIPTPNSGGVTQGTLPDAPDIRFRRDGPAGTLRLATTLADGSEHVALAQNQRGVYVDVQTKEPLGRDFGEQLYLDLAAVQAALAPRERGRPAAQSEEPQLCPAPTKDTGHGSSERAKSYEDDVHQRVNPLLPLPRGFGVKLPDPGTGQIVFFDDCFRYAGDLVDRDMKAGDLVEAKGPRKEYLYPQTWSRALDEDVAQAKKQARIAKARGVGLKWYYAEQGAADVARQRFHDEGLGDIVIATMPPRRHP